ncbi:MAG: IS110 family transposase [Thermoplasmatales archaeon]|nr:IS110 family transposase [Thermoplasmatales archaeon]
MLIGIDVHKRLVNITEMEEDGTARDNYEIENSEESWNAFTERYLSTKPEIALEQSTSGKYVARLLRDKGFSVHIADPVKLALIYNSPKKSDREDSYKLAKLLRLGELPEVHLPSEYSDDLRSLVRYRKSLGEEVTMIKNRIHALLTIHGIRIDATDIFGRRGMREIEKSFPKLKENERIVMEDMLKRLSDLFDREREMENKIALAVKDDQRIKLLMTIPGINVYSAAVIISEIDDISRFKSKEKLASYSGLVPRQDQSGDRDIRGHISKRGPSMLRFVVVTASHTAIKRSKRLRAKYLSMVRRVGRNRAIVAIARILAELIFTMLKNNKEFIDKMDSLTERKMKSMSEKARNAKATDSIAQSVKIIREKLLTRSSEHSFS